MAIKKCFCTQKKNNETKVKQDNVHDKCCVVKNLKTVPNINTVRKQSVKSTWTNYFAGIG